MPYKKTIKHMPLNYKKNHSSQTENKNKRKKSLKADINSRTASACNNIYNDNCNELQCEKHILFSKKDRTAIAIDIKNLKRDTGPDYVRIKDEMYSKPLDKAHLPLFLIHDSRYKKLKLKYLQIMVEFAGPDGITQLSRAFLASRMGCHVDTVSTISEWFVDKGLIIKRRKGYIGKNGKLTSDYTIICLQRLKDAIRYARKELKGSIKEFSKILIKYGLLLLDKYIKSIKILKEFVELEFVDPKYRKEEEIFYEDIVPKKKKPIPDILL